MYGLWNGMLLGVMLSILVGPLLLTLVQVSLEQGARAGLTVGAGIWFSDFLFIFLSYFGVSKVADLIEWSGFEPLVGTIGGLVLLLFGAGMFLTAGRESSEARQAPAGVRYTSYGSLWLTGFLINTVNPFTVFFWAGVAGTLLASDGDTELRANWFYGGLMGVVMTTDSAKVVLAKLVRRWLKPLYIRRSRRVAGAILFVFGLVMIGRVLIARI
jgi:threonine/homoserine/homoserine lactone efflux protein